MTKWITKKQKNPKTLTKWIKEELKAEDENKKENFSPQTYSKSSFLSLFTFLYCFCYYVEQAVSSWVSNSEISSPSV